MGSTVRWVWPPILQVSCIRRQQRRQAWRKVNEALISDHNVDGKWQIHSRGHVCCSRHEKRTRRELTIAKVAYLLADINNVDTVVTISSPGTWSRPAWCSRITSRTWWQRRWRPHKPSAGISLIGIHLRQYGKVDIDEIEHLQDETRILY
jgi:hypothetical protein